MSILRTGLCSLAILAAGTGLFTTITHGFRAYTSEGLLRLSVQQTPRTVPGMVLQAADGGPISIADQRQWLVEGFMYTRCATVCSIQGSGFAQLRTLLQTAISQHRVGLLSISLDPDHDTPTALARYQQRYSETHTGWLAARPRNHADLQALIKVFGVKAIPDGLGGFEHNVAFNLIDPRGRLIAILDWDDPRAAADYVLARIQR